MRYKLDDSNSMHDLIQFVLDHDHHGPVLLDASNEDESNSILVSCYGCSCIMSIEFVTLDERQLEHKL